MVWSVIVMVCAGSAGVVVTVLLVVSAGNHGAVVWLQ
jgi:hypothetical protein